MPNREDRLTELGSAVLVSNETAAAFPPSLIVASAVDVLRTEGEAFGEKLQQAGRDVTILRPHGQLHNTLVIEATRKGPTPQTLLTLVVAELKARLGPK
jgi:acetyl esterase